MTTTPSYVLLWLFVLDLGVVFGAGLYEARISLARWLGANGWDAAAARSDDVGRRFWGMAATAPLTLLTLANLYGAWTAPPHLAPWWWTAALAALGDRALTFGYFIPRMIGLLDAPDSPAIRRRARVWARANYVRLTLVGVAWVAALETLVQAQRAP